jgi:hypothetical protein
VPTQTQDVIDKLASFGEKYGEFIQGNRLNLSSISSGKVDNGFCYGVCIDWTRRILQGGRPAFSETKLKSQTFRQASLHLAIKSRGAKSAELNRLINQLTDSFNGQLELMKKDGKQDEITLLPATEIEIAKYIEFTRSLNRRYKLTQVNQWLDTLDAIADTYNHKKQPGWAALVELMDKYHIKKRTEENRDGSHRPFRHIKVVASDSQRAYGNGSVLGAIGELFKMQQFAKETVLILGFGLKHNGDDTGHSVAVHKRNDGGFNFLDPNYGAFRYALVKNQIFALLYLFGDNGIYGEDSTVTGFVDYILLGRA